ncbi:hypothetical protein Q1695_003893 [Nippostrongylus brasiliensis]|nr:hypothetical protein Q1695_003893 [Nippostrongylus brasiliensis]
MLRTVLLLLAFAEGVNCATMEIFNFKNYSDAIHKQRELRGKRGTQDLVTYWTTYYLGYVSIGTPGQGFNLLMDTGSSSIWVASGLCTTSGCLGEGPIRNKNRFDWWRSSTFKLANENFKLYYGTGEVSGFVGMDNVNMGGVMVTGQKFGIANNINHWGITPVAGIFGMGFPKSYAIPAPMQNFVRGFPSPYWIMWMNPAVINPSLGQSAGLISFGQQDNAHCRPTWQYVPVSSASDWQVALSSFQIGGYFVATTGQHALVDSGSSWMGVPQLVLNAVVKVTGAYWNGNTYLYMLPCSARFSKPELKFTIHGIIYTVPSTQYIVNLNHGNGQCVLGFMSTGSGRFNHAYILGMPWFRSFCNLFNYRERTIGFSSSIGA